MSENDLRERLSDARRGITDRRQQFARHLLQLAAADDRQVDALLHLETELKEDVYKCATIPRSTGSRITLIVPGLLGTSVRALVAPFLCARDRLTVSGYRVEVAWVNGRSGCAHNARQLRDTVLESSARSGQAVNLIGYSKGCADAIHMLGTYPETHALVNSLVSYGGVVHGTALAVDVAAWKRVALRYFPVPGTPFGDGQAIADLRPDVRRAWLETHPLPATLRLASVVAAPVPERVSRILKPGYRTLSRISSENDSQMISDDALLPGSELLAVLNADHWAIALPIAERVPALARLLIDQNRCPRDLLLRTIIDIIDAPAQRQVPGPPPGSL